MAKSDKKTLETSDKLLAATSTTATTSSVVPMDMDSAVNMATAETTIKMAAVGKDVEMSGSSIHQSDMNEPIGAETIVGSSVDDHAKKLLIEWETILISLMHQYNQAAHEKNLERQQSLESEMKQARQNLDHMRSMLTGGSGVSKPDGHQVVKTQQVNGLSNTFFGTNNKPNKATGESTPCKYCNKTWAPGHRCQEFLEHKNKKILAIKVNQEKTAQRANENESAKDIENGIRDMMMEDINFD